MNANTKRIIAVVFITAAVLTGAVQFYINCNSTDLPDITQVFTTDTADRIMTADEPTDVKLTPDTPDDSSKTESKKPQDKRSGDTDTALVSAAENTSHRNEDTDSRSNDASIAEEKPQQAVQENVISSFNDTDSEQHINTDTDTSEHIVVPFEGVWEHILVNRWNKIPDDYTFEVITLDNGRQVDSRIYDNLQQMFDDARKQDIYPIVGEAYRTSDEQKAMMQSYIDSYIYAGYDESTAKILAEQYVALPGTSEHEVGLALDINADVNQSSNESVYAWLADNAYKYGFILRYPEGKESITGINYEPWHYRYVGKEAAKEIFDGGLCLEEYLERR